MKKIKYILLPLITVFILYGFYMYTKPVKRTENLTPDFTIQSGALFNEYSKDEISANKKYLDKVIEVTGTVSDISENEKGFMNVNLATDDEMYNVACSIELSENGQFKEIKSGVKITVKGICTGMLMDVVLVKCILIK